MYIVGTHIKTKRIKVFQSKEEVLKVFNISNSKLNSILGIPSKNIRGWSFMYLIDGTEYSKWQRELREKLRRYCNERNI